jgi:hypothetical protein
MERAVMQTIKWWTVEEIKSSADTIFPSDLGSVMRRLT